jgi:hypothetical protein
MKYYHRSNSSQLSKRALYLGLSLLAVNTISSGCATKSETPVKSEISKTKITAKQLEKGVMPEKAPAKLTRDEQIKTATKDLAQRLNIEGKVIIPLSASQVTWRSGAMGCPQAGGLYTQALRPGLLIVLGANGKHYRYHSSVHGMPSYCPADRAETPATTQSDI